jgi:hypothetical protein
MRDAYAAHDFFVSGTNGKRAGSVWKNLKPWLQNQE